MAWEILTEFVEKSLEAGMSRERIAGALEDAGWSEAQVRSAMSAYADAALPVPVPRPAISATARDLFLYLMLFSSLHVMIIGLGTILYQLVNLAFPDPSDFYSYGYFAMVGGVESKLRSGLSSLAVFFPAYLYLDHRIEMLKRSDPGQGGSAVRRKLTYLALYVTVIVLMFDASSLVSYWLNGELDRRVLLKCLVVAGLAAWILGRYLHEMSTDEHFGTDRAPRARQVSLGILMVTALAAAVAAFLNIDSPGAERKRQADSARETALGHIDNSIMTYYRAYERLPDSLDEVARFQHVKFPRDPETTRPYRYERVGERDYRLCASFRVPRTPEQIIAESGPYAMAYSSTPFAEHPAGEHCFDLEVQESAGISEM